MISTLTAFLVALSEAAKAYVVFVKEKQRNEIDKIEDEIFSLGGDGSPAAKLRIELLYKRKQRKLKSVEPLRSGDGDSTTRKAVPVSGGDS